MVRFDLDDFARSLIYWEGFEPRPYRDSLGVWTVAYGMTMWRGQKVTGSFPVKVDQNSAVEALRARAWVAIQDAKDYAGTAWHYLSGPRQMVLANMAYQLGGPKLKQFTKSREFLQARDWPGFAAEILNSRWHQQTPRRAVTMSTRFKENHYV